METELIPRETAAAMITAYKQETERIQAAYAMLDTAKANLESVFGDHYSTFDPTIGTYHHRVEVTDVLKRIKGEVWKALIDKLGIKKFMGLKRAEELSRNLHDPDKLPEIELETVYSMMTTLAQNAGDFTREAIREVFDDLRPYVDGYSMNQYKTNQKNAREHIGPKIILTGMVENNYHGGFRVSYRREDRLIAMDKVFHTLDGHGGPMNDSYRSPLIDAINTSGNEGKGATPYFKFKCYHNGNLHIEFIRRDILQRFNAVAGGAALKSGNL